MAPGALALPGFYNNGEPHSNSYDNSGMASLFGDHAILFGSPGMCWSGHELSSYRSSYHTPGVAPFEFACASPLFDQPRLDELLAGNDDASEFLERFSERVMVDTPETPFLEHLELDQYQEQEDQERRALQFLEQQLGLPPESRSPSDESGLSSQDVTYSVDSDEEFVKHEPPPLNNKRIEKVEYIDDNIEAEEVSVDLIQNRRPFRCGQDGCNKTFKNPQTMKMHHKTHYTDGSAISADGLPTLPTLTPNSRVGNNKKIPSRCPKCRKTFVGLYELRRHYGRKHSEGEKPFGCRKCGKRFYIEVDVRDHEKLCGEPIECKCGLKFAFKCNLVAHKKAHPVCQEPLSSNAHQLILIPPTNSNNSSTTSTTSDEDSSGSKQQRRGGKKRQRATYEDAAITSSLMSSGYPTPAPVFTDFPAVDKAARLSTNLPGVGLATPVYASHILSSLDNYYFSQFSSRKSTLPGQSALDMMHLHTPRLR